MEGVPGILWLPGWPVGADLGLIRGLAIQIHGYTMTEVGILGRFLFSFFFFSCRIPIRAYFLFSVQVLSFLWRQLLNTVVVSASKTC